MHHKLALRKSIKGGFSLAKKKIQFYWSTRLTYHAIGWDNSKIITTNRCYHLRLCLEAWHINSAHSPLNRDDGGLLPDVRTRQLISDRIKGSLVAAFRSPLMGVSDALDRSVETLGL